MCGLARDSTAHCWGINRFGQLGDGSTTPRTEPSPVGGGLKLIGIAPGTRSTCALDNRGVLYCWGSTLNGALADGRNDLGLASYTPAAATTDIRFREVGRGCALSLAHQMYCWGTIKPAGSVTSEHMEPGDCVNAYYFYYRGKDCLTPTPVKTSLRFERGSGCPRTSDGYAYCFGSGTQGELGDGRSGPGVHAIEPVPVKGGIRFSAISGRCGLDSSGRAYCWGNNFGGQLGLGFRGGLYAEPTPVLTDERFVEIDSHLATCARTANDDVWCWGPLHAPFGITPTPFRVEIPDLP